MTYIDALRERIEGKDAELTELRAKVAYLEAENSTLTADLEHANNMIDFEINKYERILERQSKGIAHQIAYDIGLELIAIRDIAEHHLPFFVQ